MTYFQKQPRIKINLSLSFTQSRRRIPCFIKHYAIKTYEGVEVQLHVF